MIITLMLIWVICTAVWFLHIKERTEHEESEKLVLVKEFFMCSGGLAGILSIIWYFHQ